MDDKHRRTIAGYNTGAGMYPSDLPHERGVRLEEGHHGDLVYL